MPARGDVRARLSLRAPECGWRTAWNCPEVRFNLPDLSESLASFAIVAGYYYPKGFWNDMQSGYRQVNRDPGVVPGSHQEPVLAVEHGRFGECSTQALLAARGFEAKQVSGGVLQNF